MLQPSASACQQVSTLRLAPSLVSMSACRPVVQVFLASAGVVRLPGGEYCGEVLVGGEGVVFLVHGDEAGEAELFEDLLRALVVFCGEEGGAESSFQRWVECRSDDYGLYGIGAPGFDHAQPLLEIRHFPEATPQDVGVDRRGISLAAEDRFYGVQVGAGAEYVIEEALVQAGFRQLIQQAVIAAERARVVVGPGASLEVREGLDGSVVAYHDVAEVDGLALVSLVVEHG